MEDQAKETKLERELVTIMFIDLSNSTEMKENNPEQQWIPVLINFFDVITKQIQQIKTSRIIKFTGDGLMAVFDFDQINETINGAVKIQEVMEYNRNEKISTSSCTIGIASGEAVKAKTPHAALDYFGQVVDKASRLCEAGSPNAILLDKETVENCQPRKIKSEVGHVLKKTGREYFGETQQMMVKGFSSAVDYHEMVWAQKAFGVKTSVTTETIVRVQQEKEKEKEKDDVIDNKSKLTQYSDLNLSGKVVSIKPDAAFGFIEYISESKQKKTVFFHKSHTINKPYIKVGDEVHFRVEPGKKGDEAVSVIVLGSEIEGKVSSHDFINQSVYLTFRDEISNTHEVYAHLKDFEYKNINSGDSVRFIINADRQGLIAKQVRLYDPELAGVVDLRIGSSERGVISEISKLEEKGFCFATCRGNSIFIHVQEFVDREYHPVPGDLIGFVVQPGRDKGYRGTRIVLIKSAASDSEMKKLDGDPGTSN
ncbi:MAG: cold shock domain-containing protein [Magnetococcus sp. YQC-5]